MTLLEPAPGLTEAARHDVTAFPELVGPIALGRPTQTAMIRLM